VPIDPLPTPTDAVRVGLIGAGSVSRAYLRTLDALVVSGAVTAGPVGDRSASNRDALLARRPATQVVATADEVIADSDLVAILTPPDSHAELTRAALDAGRHVLVEKPLASDPAQARELAALADERGLLLALAPFVQQSPAFRLLWTHVRDGALGAVHSARGMYGNAGSTWASWYHTSGVGPLGDLAVYNLKSLTALLGPVGSVQCRLGRSAVVRDLPTGDIDPDVAVVTLTHVGGALSSVLASHAVQAYRRPALELYGSEGTANLLGDDWDPEAIELFRGDWGYWRTYPSPDRTWNWTDGLRAAVHTVRTGDRTLWCVDHDLHILDVLGAARRSAASDGRAEPVSSTFGELSLGLVHDAAQGTHVHDHTRPVDDQ
jgi:predicted dehydrogenase